MGKKLYNLTNPQKSIWLTEKYYRGTSINTICGYVFISDVTNLEVLKKAINEMVKANDGMRLKIQEDGPYCVQYVEEYKPFDIDIVELQFESQIEEKALEMANTPFFDTNDLLFQFLLFKLPNGSGGFIVNVHHLIGDSWSLGLIAKEVTSIYSELLKGTYQAQVFPSYLNYIEEENNYKNSDKFLKDKSYWEESFKTIPEIASIVSVTTEQKKEISCEGKRERFTFSENDLAGIKAFCDKNKISVYNFFMAVYSFYVSRVTNLDDFVMGTPILNRTNFNQKHTMGMFINACPLRIQLDHECSFYDFSKKIAADTLSAFRHQKYSYQSILEDVRKKDTSISNLYNIFLSYQTTKTIEENNQVHYTTDWIFNGNSSEELQIHLFDVNDEGRITVAYDYKSGLFDSQEITNLHVRILNIIHQIIENDIILLKEIEIVTPEEKHKILYDFNNTNVDYPRDKTIVDLFEEQVEKTPDNIAVVFEDQKLTYRELNEKANRLAYYLIENGVKSKDIIGIMLHRTPEMILSILSVLKAGATYLPIDPEYPIDRINYMLSDSKASTVLVHSATSGLDIGNTCKKITVDFNHNLLDNFSCENVNYASPDGLIYLIYTSGSTGNPKGVMVTHKNIVNFILGEKQYISFSSDKVMVSVTTICFDIFSLELWGALTSGIPLVLANDIEQMSPIQLKELCDKNHVTMIQTTPSRYSTLLTAIDNKDGFWNNFTDIMVGGEPFPKLLLEKLHELTNANIFNMYGPTETTVWSTIKDLSKTSQITIGKPIANTNCYILNKDKNLLPINIPGELYIGGDGVTAGYWNRKELTDEKFEKSPFHDNETIYNTGDLAYINNSGDLVHLGRTDSQVKIRGYRIELEEIENKILKYHGIINCVVNPIDSASKLCAYYISDNEIQISTLKHFLLNELPNYMVPNYFIKMNSLPHTPNGKIDRKKLPMPKIEVNKKGSLARNKFDTILIDIFKNLLNIETVDIESSLYDLGGDSLTAINLTTSIYNKLGLPVTTNDIIQHPTIKELSDYINTLSEDVNKNTIKKIEKSSYYPASSAQKRMYYSSSIDSNSILYNIAGGVIIDKTLDINILQKCFQTLIDRHEVLRTHFNVVDNDIVQIINDKIDFNLSVEKEISDDLNTIYANFVKPFDLTKAPLFRAKVVALKDNKMLLLLDMHHIISDGTSLSILLQELCDLYNGNTLPEKQVDYKDFTLWEKGQFETEEFKQSKDFWVNQYKDEIPLLNMPTTFPRPSVQSFEGSNYHTKLSKDTFEKVNEVSKNLGVTPYMLMLSVYYILLSNYTSQDDIVVGTPIVGRELPELSNMLGMFVNTLALRNKVDHNSSFSDFANMIKEYCLSAFKNQGYPFDELVKELHIKRDTSRSPLFDIMFAYQNNGYPTIDFKDSHTEYFIPDNEISKFDLTLEIIPMNKEISLRFEYCTKLFDEDFIQRLSSHYINILNAILKNPEIKIADIDILSKEERNQILYDFNNTKMDYPRDKTIVDLFEKQVEKTPDNIAVVFEDQKLTYRELNEKANQLARVLVQNDVKIGDIIGIYLNKSLEVVVSMFAILKAGAAFLPLDIDYPENRLNYIINNSTPKLILSSKKITSKIKVPMLLIDLDAKIYEEQDTTNVKISFSPEEIMYVMYTSGSTGNPKGVMVKHKNIIRLAAFPNFIEFSENEVMVQTGTIVFDACIFEIFGSLLHGFKLFILKKENILNVPYFSNFLEKEKVTILFLTTGLFNQLGLQNPSMFRNLKYLLTGGDVISKTSIQKIRSCSPNLKIINCYGPTENGSYSTCYQVIGNEEIIPIGKPITNSTAYVVSPLGKLCPIGVPGELWVGGDGVAKGYLNNDGLTEEQFIDNPFRDGILYKTGDLVKWLSDGNIVFMGRIDNQVKVRGFRIELSEIDKQILSVNNIKQSLTILQNINNTKTICSYIVSDDEININNLKHKLEKYLPNYMLPTFIMQLKEFPLNINGKVDTKSFPIPTMNNIEREIIPARNNLDKLVIDTLSKVLNITNISIEDSFFDLGGDSLSAISFTTALSYNLNISITVGTIFQHPTIKELSDYIATLSKNSNKNTIKKAEKSTYYPASSAQKRMYYASSIENDSILYNNAGGIIVDKILDINILQKCFQTLIGRNEVLRTHFNVVDNDIVQIINDKIDFNLSVEKEISDDLNTIYANFVKPFDLTKAPLFRAKVVALKDNKMLLLLDMHHIISDGTSLSILLQELCDLYNGNTLPEKQVDYKDFTLWEKGQFETEEFKQSKDFWVNQYKDEIPLLNMPTTFPRPSVQSFEGSNYHTKLSKDTFEKVNEVSKNLGVTPYMLMLSVYYILLSNYTSQDDIVVGTPIVGRELPELSNMLGMFVNTLALRNKVDHNSSFSDFANMIKEYCLSAFKNQGYPFDELVKELHIKRDTSRSPLVDVMFIYQNNGYPTIDFKDAHAEYFIPDSNISKFDLSLEVIPVNNEFSLRFEYCTKLFDEEFIKRLSLHYINILNAILENQDIKIADIDMLSKEERNQILYDFNKIEAKTNNDTFVSLFEEQVKKYPNNIALICDDKSLTYSELNKKANSLAHFLLENNVKPNDIIAIMTDRSFETVICMLAILKSGAAFVNMDPTYPVERTTYYLNDCKAKCVLKQKYLKLPIDNFKNIFEIDLYNDEIYTKNTENPNISIDLQSLSYVIYTSGSTGIPKGVALHHIGLANMCKAMTLVLDYLKDAPNHTLLSVTSTPFDIFVYEIVVPLSHGMRIVLANNAEHRNPKLIDGLIRKHNVDVMTVTPSLMKINYDNREPNSALVNVKNMVFGGEPLSEKFVHDLKALSSDITIYNIYGPCEITVLSNVQNLDGEKEINIGPPILNTKIYVLDNDMNPVPVGFSGEIYIGGVQVGCGYLGKEDLTKQKFIKNPFAEGRMFKSGDIGRWTKDGKLQCLGRFDHQVKLRGLRIELGEIEKLLESIPEVDEAVVNKVIVNGKEVLCAYYVLNSDIDEILLRTTLKEKLPYYMVPTYFMKLDCMPYSLNRKIDRKALPTPTANNINLEKIVDTSIELTSTAQQLLHIWQNILNVPNISVNDNFFDIGGDSIAAIQVQIESVKNGINIEYSDIFKYPTIKQLSTNIKRNELFDIASYNNERINKLLKKNNVHSLSTIRKTKIRNILVIGTTGYLGVHLIHEFLTKYRGNVYCLIRPKNRIEPNQRLEDIFTFYFGKKCFNKYKNRMIIVKGDITMENMGMSQEEINTIQNNVDVVINSGALVKHYGESKLFEDINVTGTQNVVNFCAKNKIRLLHISTISVSGNGEKYHKQEENVLTNKIFSEQNLYIDQKVNGIYTYTKFKAETIVLNAILNGLDAMILRVGNITNRYSDGVFQRNYKDNAFAQKIKSFIEIGAFPEYFLEHELELTPVDLCAEAIIKILYYNSDCNVLHIYNSNLLPITLFLDVVHSLNIEMKPVSNKDMVNIITKILEDDNKKNMISGIIYDLDNNKNLIYTSNISLDSTFSNKYLAKVGFSWKKPNKSYLRRCLNYFNKIGFINF